MTATKKTPRLKWRDLPTAEEALAEELRDPAFRREWERTALARAVALRLVRFRTEHGLTQTALARRLGVSQPAVAAMEQGDRNPQIAALSRLSHALGITFLIEIAPRRGRPRWLTAAARRAQVVEQVDTDGNRVLIAAN